MSKPRPTDQLIADAQDHLDAALGHRFFTEATDGTLAPEVFHRYLRIEYAFVDTAARALGRTVHVAPSFERRRDLATALSHLVFEQYDYFHGIAGGLGLRLPGPDDPVPPLARPLHDHVLGLAAGGEYLPLLAGSLGAEWLYATWCNAAVRRPTARDEVLQQWIELHAGSSFLAHVDWLRAQLDDGLAQAEEETAARCLAAYIGTVDAEIPFHEAAYVPEPASD